MKDQWSTKLVDAEYQPGELLRRRKGLVMHTGVSLGNGRVLHNTPARGEHVSSFEDFARGKTVRVSPGSNKTRERVQDLDISAFERRYNPLTNNCEHTASRATDGHASSPQLRKLALEAVAGAALLLLFRKPLLAFAARAAARAIGKMR